MRRLHPKQAVLEFFERYTAITDRKELKYHFHDKTVAHPSRPRFFVAELLCPVFYNGIFEGHPKRTEAQAEISAAEVFTADPHVVEAAGKLPPHLGKIRQRVALNRQQKDAILWAGLSPYEFSRRMIHQVYMGFQQFGCRTAIWDNNL
ncbi:unnamed protein product [Symbiodinium natans]|uniref:Uncharacterized protein n=1 Tax=Symbiodinium natans TaxID=878477 RepID=A0A812N0D9_9DINO|nr:unnamed protein product [Symbiodinium natans]